MLEAYDRSMEALSPITAYPNARRFSYGNEKGAVASPRISALVRVPSASAPARTTRRKSV